MADLTGKIALVTGAARGIGQAIALRLAADGADVALADLKQEWLDDTAGKIRALGRRAECFAVDVSDGAAVAAAVDAAVAAFGKLDILVNNAGITRDGLLVRMDEASWDAVLGINLKGVFLMTKAAARHMMKARSGAIVNVASIVGITGNPGQANYTASKGGVIALTKTCAKELGARGIRVNAVAPGFIHTAMTDALKPELREAMLKTIPLARAGEPEDVAAVVAFLAGPDAAYVSGQTIPVCGGMI
ncbi:MAG: 3-oxoacyl-[Kiritimatiellae bacterium]|nr:3-oxoacyl-[acyl-carrier-protein] reductase [Kiritimatiellia bacterium]